MLLTGIFYLWVGPRPGVRQQKTNFHKKENFQFSPQILYTAAHCEKQNNN